MAKIARSPKLEKLDGDLPVLILHSQPDEESLFVVVHEPYLAKGYITSVKQQPAKPGELVVDVRMPDRADRVIMWINEQPLNYNSGGIKTDAVLAAVSVVKGKEPVAWMVGGTELDISAARIKLQQDQARFEGTIVNSFRKIDGDTFYGFELTGDNLRAAGAARGLPTASHSNEAGRHR